MQRTGNACRKSCFRNIEPMTGDRAWWPWGFRVEEMPSKFPRNLQQDPRSTDPEKSWVSNSSIATYWTGSVGKVPFNFWWKFCCVWNFRTKEDNYHQHIATRSHIQSWKLSMTLPTYIGKTPQPSPTPPQRKTFLHKLLLKRLGFFQGYEVRSFKLAFF